jgi:hypothetical protein
MIRTARPTIVLAALFALITPNISEATRDRPPPRQPAPPRPQPQPGPAEQICTARVVVRQTEGASGCFIDERVTQAPGVLRYPCAGGPATATFGANVFAGTVGPDGAVNLALRTTFHFSDGCDWQSAQSITGALASRHLTFSYQESPVAGQRGCARPCRATGDAALQ